MTHNPTASTKTTVPTGEDLKQQLINSFTPDTPQSARNRIVEAIIEALNEPEDD